MALFPDEPRLVGYIAAKGNGTWEVTVTIGAIRRAKLQWNRHHQHINTQLFTGRTLPVAQPTVSKHWREKHWRENILSLSSF